MSSDSKRAPDGALSAEPHTDPMIPVITDDMLPPLENPRVPTLDDRALAALLAELDGDENVPFEADQDPLYDPLDPVDALDRSAPKLPVRPLTGPPSPRAAPDTPPRGPGAGTRRPAGPTSPPRPGAPVGPPRVAADRAAGAAETPDPSYLTQSPVGPVLRSRYGEYRPPVVSPVVPDVPSLTGLTRRSRSKLGSRLFTVVFVAIFVLILIQTVVSVFSESAGH